MAFANRFNNSRKFDVDTSNFEYMSLAELYHTHGETMVYPLTAIYINTKSMYGKAPVFATDDCFVNIPSHMLKTVNEILADEKAVAEINNGKVGFKIYTYHADKYNRDCFGISFVDM